MQVEERRSSWASLIRSPVWSAVGDIRSLSRPGRCQGPGGQSDAMASVQRRSSNGPQHDAHPVGVLGDRHCNDGLCPLLPSKPNDSPPPAWSMRAKQGPWICREWTLEGHCPVVSRRRAFPLGALDASLDVSYIDTPSLPGADLRATLQQEE